MNIRTSIQKEKEDIKIVEKEIQDTYDFLINRKDTLDFNVKTFLKDKYKDNLIYIKAKLEKYIESSYYSEMLKLVVGTFSVINILSPLFIKNNTLILFIIDLLLIAIFIYTILSYVSTNKNKTKARYILSIMDSINQK